MRKLILITALSVLTACSTPARMGPLTQAPVNGASPQQFNKLPAQTLAENECGLFLFSTRAPHDFIVFENLTLGRVKIIYENQILEIEVNQQNSSFVQGDVFRRVYRGGDRSVHFTLTGIMGPRTPSGQVINNGLLKMHYLDGTNIVQPLGGVHRCGRLQSN